MADFPIDSASDLIHLRGESGFRRCYAPSKRGIARPFSCQISRADFKEFRVALRLCVGSLEPGMMHQLQMNVTLARERIKQLEQMIESLQKSVPAEMGKEGTAWNQVFLAVDHLSRTGAVRLAPLNPLAWAWL